MKFSFEADAGGRLLCRLEDADGAHEIAASNADAALSDLAAALDDLASAESSECYWQDDACDYRWLFKREGARTKLAVLRLTGVCPGYQHVAWTEQDTATLLGGLRSAMPQHV
jgi:hypothetical protein